MNKGIIKCLKNSIGEKGNYCYSLPVETTKAVIKELNRLKNIIDELEKWCNECIDNRIIAREHGYTTISDTFFEIFLDKLKKLKENNK